jgi:DNA-binding transcriptional regulator YbjK
MTEFMTTALDPYAFQVDKHRAGLQSVAEGFASAPVSLPVDVHELFHRYLTASDTVVVPRMLFLQMYFDLNRAWEATGRDITNSGHGEFYKTFMGVVGRILDMPTPFCDAGKGRQQWPQESLKGGATDG